MTEFKQWLKKNHNYFRSCTSDEIAYFALMNGFSLEEACGGTNDFLIHIKRLLTFWENPLSEQWLNLVSHERGND